jgi:hypothetical protein
VLKFVKYEGGGGFEFVVSQEFPRSFPGVSQEFPRSFPGVSQEFLRSFLGVS